MDGLIDKAKTIRAWCKLTCGAEPEKCGKCQFVKFLLNFPKYDCTKCFLWERDEDE